MALFPELIKEYSVNNETDPDGVLPTYSLTVDWDCSQCGMTWTGSIRDRVNGDMQCPFCSGKRAIPGKTSFMALYPELLGEWYTIANILLVNPDQVSPTSPSEVWWICKNCGKSYSMSIKTRVIMDLRSKKACPYCKGYRRKKRHIL